MFCGHKNSEFDLPQFRVCRSPQHIKLKIHRLHRYFKTCNMGDNGLCLRSQVVEMMERHLCAHPLIPGYSAPMLEGVREWAVKQIYQFCATHDLLNLWTYLWEDWYWSRRWELWARCVVPEIPRLKTTMMVEAQYLQL
jgi:hypothetical protein